MSARLEDLRETTGLGAGVAPVGAFRPVGWNNAPQIDICLPVGFCCGQGGCRIRFPLAWCDAMHRDDGRLRFLLIGATILSCWLGRPSLTGAETRPARLVRSGVPPVRCPWRARPSPAGGHLLSSAGPGGPGQLAPRQGALQRGDLLPENATVPRGPRHLHGDLDAIAQKPVRTVGCRACLRAALPHRRAHASGRLLRAIRGGLPHRQSVEMALLELMVLRPGPGGAGRAIRFAKRYLELFERSNQAPDVALEIGMQSP